MKTLLQVCKNQLQSSHCADVTWAMNVPALTARAVASKSFAGTKNANPEPLTNWALRDIISEDFEDLDRKAMFDFVMSIVVEDAIKDDAFIFGHDTISPETNHVGDLAKKEHALGSVAVVTSFDPAKQSSSVLEAVRGEVGDLLKLAIAGIRGRLPRQLYTPSKMATLLRRMVSLQGILKTAHIEYGPATKHLFVQVVAMDPDFQGRGYGKQMMNAINDLADHMGKAVYLECGGKKNPRFYEKFGYEVVHEQELQGEDGENFIAYLMVREPKQNLEATHRVDS